VTPPGPFLLTDERGRSHLVAPTVDGTLHTRHGWISHTDIAAAGDGGVVHSSLGMAYLVTTPTMAEQIVRMPRGAAVIYPKDIAVMLMTADITNGNTVVEAGAGSGALTAALLRAVGPSGRVLSAELRPEFAAVARRNVARLCGGVPANWVLTEGDLREVAAGLAPTGSVDAVALDMLAPWECLDASASLLAPGGVLVGYVATTTQLSTLVESMRAHGAWTEPRAEESLMRTWHLEGLSVRPDHRMNGHTGFLATARRLAPGTTAPVRRRRPAPSAYGEDYSGPRATPGTPAPG